MRDTDAPMYEVHPHPDTEFPIIFHRDTLSQSQSQSQSQPLQVALHYHPNMELLLVREGEIAVKVDTKTFFAKKDQLAVIRPGSLHTIVSVSGRSVYDCMIPDMNFVNALGVDLSRKTLPRVVQNHLISQAFDLLYDEVASKQPYYKCVAKAHTTYIIGLLCRLYAIDTFIPDVTPKNLSIIKNALDWLSEHYLEPCSPEEISDALGFSKSYLLHRFKEVTGYTIIEYRNILRCEYARSLLLSGSCNVSETAAACGFQNLSYFSKLYLSHWGVMPSKEAGQAGVQ